MPSQVVLVPGYVASVQCDLGASTGGGPVQGFVDVCARTRDVSPSLMPGTWRLRTSTSLDQQHRSSVSAAFSAGLRPSGRAAVLRIHKFTPTYSTAGTKLEASSNSIRQTFHTLDDDLRLEVLSLEESGTTKPPVVFIHGSGHGAWCWQERFLPYFKLKGFSSYAISLRGQAGSDRPRGKKTGGTLVEHADDISSFIGTLPRPPILVGHSFGGLVVQTYILKDYKSRANVAGVGLLAAAPPQGNDAMVKRFFQKSWWHAAKLTWTFVTKSYLKNTSAARFLLFSEDLEAELVDRYAALLRENRSELPVVDVSKLKTEVPLPPPTEDTPPVLVIGGDRDNSIDVEGLRETAAHYAVEPIILQNVAHDLMLDTRWHQVATRLEDWCVTLQ